MDGLRELAGVLRGEERHNRADILGLTDPLERLHAKNEGFAIVGLAEVLKPANSFPWQLIGAIQRSVPLFLICLCSLRFDK